MNLANLPLARMPLFDSQRGVDAPWLFEAMTLAGVRSQRMPPRFAKSPTAPLRPPKRRSLAGSVAGSDEQMFGASSKSHLTDRA